MELCVARNHGSHGSAVAIRFYFELAVQFAKTLAHSGQTDSSFGTHSAQQGQPFSGDALPEIANLEGDRLGIVLQLMVAFVASE